MTIIYKIGNDLDIDAVLDLYRASTLGERRPIDDRPRMAQMIKAANLVITAWDANKLIGISRSLSDFSFCTYLSDLAVDSGYQHRGIGKELIRRTQDAGGRATIYLFAAPAAKDYYPKIGFSPGDGFILKESEHLK